MTTMVLSNMRLTALLGTDFWNDSCDPNELAEAVSEGAVGATSNPVIVHQVVQQGGSWWTGVLDEFSDLVEVLGMDEAYIDLSDSPAPKTRARQLKFRIKERTRLTCSVGIGPNWLIAKIASDLDKPDGLCVLPQERFLDVIGERPARIIPGVGPKTAERLNEAVGPVHVIAPTRGFSLADAEGGDLWDPVADHAFLDALRRALRADIPFEQVDLHVDDEAFADLVAQRYLSLIQEPAHAG